MDAALDSAWEMIVKAVKDRRSAFHTPTLATLDSDGAPSARTVVLRAADASAWTLRCHTDWRSPKAAQITADDRVMFHFYDPVHKVQVRAAGTAVLHRLDAMAEAAFDASAKSAQQCYFAEPGPSTPVAEPTNGWPTDAADYEDRDRGLDAFTAVVVTVNNLDWVHLDHRGHRRALFEREGEQVSKQWLVP